MSSALLSALCLSTPLYGQSRVESLEARLSVVAGANRMAVLAESYLEGIG